LSTIRDVAKHAGVSAGTVSNVLNRPSYVNDSTRTRVLAAMEELDFVPRQHARQYRPGRVKTIGVTLASLAHPFFVDIALGAEAYARERDVAVVFCNSSYDPQREEYNLDVLVQQRVQGVVMTPVDENNPRLESMLKRGVPVVFIDDVTSDRPWCSLVTDNHAGGVMAGRHLAGLGHTSLVFVDDPSSSHQVAERLAGFREGVAAVSPDATIEVLNLGDFSTASGIAAGEAVAAMAPADRPTAALCANDLLAIGFLQSMTLHGIRVPEDIAIVGFDDLDAASASAIPLSSVRQPRHELGARAMKLVLDEIEQGSEHVHEHQVLMPELIIRKSSGVSRLSPSA
jgi:LacI family transcriptional regulator